MLAKRSGALCHLALLPELDTPVHRFQFELAAAGADGALDAALGEAALDGEGEVRGDVAVDGLGAELGVEAGGEVDADGAVDGLEGQLTLPVGAAEDGVDAAVHGLAAGHPCRLDADAAVHGVGLGVGREGARVDGAVHGAPREAHARGDAHPELHAHVVVAGVHAPAAARLALVGGPVPRRVHGADGHPARVLDHLDLDVVGVAAAGSFDRGHLDVRSRGRVRVDAAVDALDLDGSPRRYFSLPVEVVGP